MKYGLSKVSEKMSNMLGNMSDTTNDVTITTKETTTEGRQWWEDFAGLGTAYLPVGFILGVVTTCIIVVCYNRKRRRSYTANKPREESFHHDNAVYWDHDVSFDGMAIMREQRRTEALIITDCRHKGVQTDIYMSYLDHMEENFQQPIHTGDLDMLSLGPLPPPPPPPLNEDSMFRAPAPKPPRRTSKDDCITKTPSYRRSNIPSCLQKTWFFGSSNKLCSSNNFAEFLDEEFKDQNSPLHQGQDHYMSVPSVVLIPNPEAGPTPCNEVRHSYINIQKLGGNRCNVSENSSLNHSQQILVDYENTKVWVSSTKESSDFSDDETYIDCQDKNFQESVRDTLRRKESQTRCIAEGDDQYSSFATLSSPKKPDRPRTGYVVMELTEEVMSFLKVRENKISKHVFSKENIPSAIYYDDRIKNGYMSMSENLL